MPKCLIPVLSTFMMMLSEMRRRYVAQVISESTNVGAGPRPFYSWLESCLRHKGEMVIMEAARAIVNMPEVTQRELQPAVTVLQLFLTSSKPTLRFAAVRTLNKVRDFLVNFVSLHRGARS